MTKNFEIEKRIPCRHKNREFMLNFVLNSQKMTNVNINVKIENDDFDNNNEK